jgi:hypothetical protein
MRMLPFVRHLLFVCAFFVVLLALLHPSSIVEFVLTLVCVTPAYLLFERGRMWLGVVVFFVGMVVSAIVSAVMVYGSGLF